MICLPHGGSVCGDAWLDGDILFGRWTMSKVCRASNPTFDQRMSKWLTVMKDAPPSRRPFSEGSLDSEGLRLNITVRTAARWHPIGPSKTFGSTALRKLGKNPDGPFSAELSAAMVVAVHRRSRKAFRRPPQLVKEAAPS